MASSTRFTVVVLSVALMGVAVARPGWLEVLGVEFAVNVQPENQLISEPSDVQKGMMKRIVAKCQVMDRLRAREMTLFEAASWFGRLNQEPPAYPHRKLQVPGQTEEEKLCQEVIHWMKGQAQYNAPEGDIDQTIVRLEAELADHLHEYGRIKLPAWR